MTYVCRKWLKVFEKRLKYVGNYADLWEMVKIFGKFLKCLTNVFNMWEFS